MAAISYLDAEGNVKLPPHIIDHLGLKQGGGLVFVTKGADVLLMTNERAMLWAGCAEKIEGSESNLRVQNGVET